MKYVTPKYEAYIVETEDILTASSGQIANYEVEDNKDGTGNVIVDALSIFR